MKAVHGLLMNARFIQGVFDDKAAPERFARFGWDTWDPEKNTNELIDSLPEWYHKGLRAITVGFQGGMPVLTTENVTIDRNPFAPDGLSIDPAYLSRMERIIRAADRIGMVVIVSILYQGQAPRMGGGIAVFNSVRTASTWLKEQKYTNVIIELNKPILCNEDSPCFTRLDVAFDTRTSWGYYNTHTKQEPPGQWGIANAEDLFFARRMAKGLGIPADDLEFNDQHVLLGLNDFLTHEGKRWIRLASESPETVKCVEYFKNGEQVDAAYEEPFYVAHQNTWMHGGTETSAGDEWRAVVHLADGRILERAEIVQMER